MKIMILAYVILNISSPPPFAAPFLEVSIRSSTFPYALYARHLHITLQNLLNYNRTSNIKMSQPETFGFQAEISQLLDLISGYLNL